MQFSTTLLLTALASLVAAQNPFSFTTLPESIAVGKPFNITWSPSTGTTDTVTLLLRQGDPDHLATVATIASKIQNTGSYIWTPDSTLVSGTGYAFEIVDDGNTVIVNYSGQFAISSPNTVSSPTAAPTAAPSSSSPTGTGADASPTGTGAGSETSGSAESKTSAAGSKASKTSAGATTVPSIGAAVGVKVSGGLLALVGGIMAAL